MIGHWCARCGNYIWKIEDHKCPPKFRVWCTTYGQDEEDALEVYAISPSAAAELWADRSDSKGDYDIVGGSEVRVVVKAGNGKEITFDVVGHSEPVYEATEVEDDARRSQS